MPQEHSSSSTPAFDRLLRPSEVATLVGLKPSTLSAYRKRSGNTGGVPLPYVRLNGQCVRYKLSDVQAWIAEKESQL
jgi:predicted DNA-binding transcriptional regulator AlpA